MHPHISRKMYHIEVISPRQDTPDLEESLERLAVKYRQIVAAGQVVCIPDNPLGNLAFQGTELIQELGLPVNPDQVSIHLNTFHTRANLDWLLTSAVDLGLRHILVISGDGSERQPKLQGAEIGYAVASVTSVELVKYVHREYPGRFEIGVAFNPYEPLEHELEKMRRKVDAGASSVTTQPIIGQHPALEELRQFKLPIIVEAWMSKRLHLLSDCVGYEIPADASYEPLENLQLLVRNYPDCGFYLSMLGFKTQFPLISRIWS